MTTASDGTYYNLDTSACGDFPECHDEDNPCGCPPVGECWYCEEKTIRTDDAGEFSCCPSHDEK